MMVQHLAGSLAMVTCKDPLRGSIGNNLRSLLLTSLGADAKMTQQTIDQAVTVAVAENLDLACAFIEKSAMERAVPEIDESLKEDYHTRSKFREQRRAGGFVDGDHYAPATASLPPYLRPTANGLEGFQYALYDNYMRAAPSLKEAGVLPSVAAGTPVAAGPKGVLLSPGGLVAGTAPRGHGFDKLFAELEALAARFPAGRELASVPHHEIHGVLRSLQAAAQDPARPGLMQRLAQRSLVAVLELDPAAKVLREALCLLLHYLEEVHRPLLKELTKM